MYVRFACVMLCMCVGCVCTVCANLFMYVCMILYVYIFSASTYGMHVSMYVVYVLYVCLYVVYVSKYASKLGLQVCMYVEYACVYVCCVFVLCVYVCGVCMLCMYVMYANVGNDMYARCACILRMCVCYVYYRCVLCM